MSIKNVKQSPSYPFMTKKAADCMVDCIDRMIEKLSKMEHVEYFEPYEDGMEVETSGFNDDTCFREQFLQAVEDEVRYATRRYSE